MRCSDAVACALRFAIVAEVVDPRALEVGRQEGAAVVGCPAEVRRRIDGDVAGQILVLGPQPIEQPGPIDGRVSEASAVPVCNWMTASGWAGVSVCSPRMKQSLSTCLATLGKSSETHVPVWPCWRELELRGSERAAARADLAVVFWSCGLYSKVSIWDMAPSMNRKMIRLALAGKCGGFGRQRPGTGGVCPAARRRERRSGRAARPAPGSRSRRRRACSACRRET